MVQKNVPGNFRHLPNQWPKVSLGHLPCTEGGPNYPKMHIFSGVFGPGDNRGLMMTKDFKTNLHKTRDVF